MVQLSVSISGGHTFGFLGRGAAAKTDRPISFIKRRSESPSWTADSDSCRTSVGAGR